MPHTWGVMEEHADYDGVAWYRRTFTLPAEAQDAHLRLHFEAVLYLARVWLNGEYLGVHEGGYTPFEFDVSEIAKAGAENVIAVQVDNKRDFDRIPARLNEHWSFDWWNYGGIVRDVSLQMTSRAFIATTRHVVEAMAERFGDTPHVIGWQLDNEYNRVCYCGRRRDLFQRYLADKFGPLGDCLLEPDLLGVGADPRPHRLPQLWLAQGERRVSPGHTQTAVGTPCPAGAAKQEVGAGD